MNAAGVGGVRTPRPRTVAHCNEGPESPVSVTVPPSFTPRVWKNVTARCEESLGCRDIKCLVKRNIESR